MKTELTPFFPLDKVCDKNDKMFVAYTVLSKTLNSEFIA